MKRERKRVSKIEKKCVCVCEREISHMFKAIYNIRQTSMIRDTIKKKMLNVLIDLANRKFFVKLSLKTYSLIKSCIIF